MTNKNGGADLAPLNEFDPVIILARPQMAENIGACARAMGNGGLFHLRLVAPRDGWPQEVAWRTASGADKILDAAEVFDTLDEAVSDLNRIFATCPRPRHVVTELFEPHEAALEMRALAKKSFKTGIIFGSERAGLDAEELSRADSLIRYPLNPGFMSLNLAQAVLVMAYEWWMSGRETVLPHIINNESKPATKEDITFFLDRLIELLGDKGFLRNEEKREGMVRNMRHFFTRGEMTEQELRTLHGIITSLVGEPHS